MVLQPPLTTCRNGFTLIEIMVVVTIVGLLAAIAIPGYQRYVINGNRSVATSALATLHGKQESFFTDRKRYATKLTDLGYAADTVYLDNSGAITKASKSSSKYSLTISSGATATAWSAVATPLNIQTKDTDCAKFSIDQTGAKAASGPKGVACW